jgi:hypothetical protein
MVRTPLRERASATPDLARRALTLARFLRRLTSDAERGHRARLEPFDPDLPSAFLALAVNAAVDAGKGLVNLAQKLALAVTHPEQKGAVGFQRGAIGRVGAGFLSFSVERAERALGFLQNLASAILEQATEEIQVPLPHNNGALEVQFRFY